MRIKLKLVLNRYFYLNIIIFIFLKYIEFLLINVCGFKKIYAFILILIASKNISNLLSHLYHFLAILFGLKMLLFQNLKLKLLNLVNI